LINKSNQKSNQTGFKKALIENESNCKAIFKSFNQINEQPKTKEKINDDIKKYPKSEEHIA
jgi:hypothetical protein